jgi:hypothetical protein
VSSGVRRKVSPFATAFAALMAAFTVSLLAEVYYAAGLVRRLSVRGAVRFAPAATIVVACVVS